MLDHDVTNPRDRVYGMLGMIHSQSDYAQKNPLKPDYAKTVQAVYQEACEWCIKDMNNLKILDLCDAPATNQIKNMPTWVPDLSKGFPKCDSTRTWHLSSNTSQILPMFSPQFSTSINGKLLTSKGLLFDTVTTAQRPFTRRHRPLLDLHHFYALVSQTIPYPTGCAQIEAYWRTILGNTIRVQKDPRGNATYEAPPTSFGKNFMKYMAQDFLHNFGLPQKLTGQEPDLWQLRRDSAPFPLDDLYPQSVNENISILALMAREPFVRMLYDSLGEGDDQVWVHQIIGREWVCQGDEGRQIFLTKRGFMGLGQPCPLPLGMDGLDMSLPDGSGVQVGDKIALLAGSDRVWILRWGGSNYYTIVGQAYVYGLSDGTCFDPKNVARMENIRIK